MVEIASAQRQRVYRKKGTALSPKNIISSRKWRASRVMVWGCMSAAGVGMLHHCETSITKEVYIEILKLNLRRSRAMLSLRPGWIFMHDNAPAHRAGVTKKWLKLHRFKVMKWPANSPDLNPIEHLWSILKKILKSLGRVKKAELFPRAKEAWDKITTAECRKLVESMPRRLAAVIEAKGGNTRY